MPSFHGRQNLRSGSLVPGSLLETYRDHRLGMDGLCVYHLLFVSEAEC